MRFETRLTKIDPMGHRWKNFEPNERRGTNSVAKTGELLTGELLTGELLFDNDPNCGQNVRRGGLKSLTVNNSVSKQQKESFVEGAFCRD
jgi:hypothetical protein